MLPNLPKKNKKKEADFGLKFRELLNKHLPDACYPFELKDTRGKSNFNYSELTLEQVNHLLRSKSVKGNLIRVISGTPGSPDYIYLKKCQYAFVVINYPKAVITLDIDDFINEQERSKRKSLTEARAKEIATKVINK